MTTDADKLIYQNSNAYRLHADSLRWTLLGGYAVFLAAVLGLSSPGATSAAIMNPILTLLGFIVSFAYLWILAVQNWFYNLFARWVDDCESRLVKDERLRGLQTFAKAAGSSISPFHPAFFFAEMLVGSVAYYLLAQTIVNATVPVMTPALLALPSWASTGLWVVGFIGYFGILNVVFLRWDRMVYKPVLSKLSNLYQPGVYEPIVP